LIWPIGQKWHTFFNCSQLLLVNSFSLSDFPYFQAFLAIPVCALCPDQNQDMKFASDFEAYLVPSKDFDISSFECMRCLSIYQLCEERPASILAGHFSWKAFSAFFLQDRENAFKKVSLHFDFPWFTFASSFQKLVLSIVAFISRFPFMNYQVVVIGDSGTGKTSILSHLTTGGINPNVQPSIQLSAHSWITKVSSGANVRLSIWDTAGQEKYKSIGPMYWRAANAAVVVFDLTDSTTFRHVDEWIQLFRNETGEDTLIIVIANKSDMQNEQEVSGAALWSWGEGHSTDCYMTSAYTGEGIQEAFGQLAERLASTHVSDPETTLILLPEQRRKRDCCS
jgi:small GTP-binding protein